MSCWRMERIFNWSRRTGRSSDRSRRTHCERMMTWMQINFTLRTEVGRRLAQGYAEEMEGRDLKEIPTWFNVLSSRRVLQFIPLDTGTGKDSWEV